MQLSDFHYAVKCKEYEKWKKAMNNLCGEFSVGFSGSFRQGSDTPQFFRHMTLDSFHSVFIHSYGIPCPPPDYKP